VKANEFAKNQRVEEKLVDYRDSNEDQNQPAETFNQQNHAGNHRN
jgi:hypothetical protein